MVSAFCAFVILLVEGVAWYFPELASPFRIFVVTACTVILIDLYVRSRERGIKYAGKLGQLKEENERLAAQLAQVLVERKDAERQVAELREAIQHEKTRSARAITQSNSGGDGALTLLAMLQAKGRFVDFLMEDIAIYDDPRVAAAARFVHQGCKSALQEHAEIAPLESKREGDELIVEASYDPSRIKVIGKIAEMPCKGVLLHRGWKANFIKLPQLVAVTKATEELIISPAEVEVR